MNSMKPVLDDVSKELQKFDTRYGLDNQQEAADEAGMLLVLPKDNELQIDIDSEEGLATTRARLSNMQEFLAIKNTNLTPSKTPGHYHMTIQLYHKDYTDLEKVALQFMLGSDTKRECINVLRILAGTDDPIAFFEPKPN